jgi:meso-butanediol dehydrogenase/(S,S)-butanediol dehydrogenase/diacetyl reductase
MSGRFAGKTLFITGASSGIGRATAVLFAEEGASVFAIDVNEGGVSETAAMIRQAGGRAEARACDVTKLDAVQAAVAACVAEFGGVDVQVAAAGVGYFKRLEEMGADDFARVVGVNLGGVYNTTRAAIEHLVARKGVIVNIASTAAMRGTAYGSLYAASKAGVLNFTRSVALEFASRGVRANCVCPGGVKTAMARGFIPPADCEPQLLAYQRPPAVGTWAEPADIAKTIAFLASDDARMINGAGLLVDSGTLA